MGKKVDQRLPGCGGSAEWVMNGYRVLLGVMKMFCK